MSYMAFQSSDRDRRCRICNCLMVRDTFALVLCDVHVPPKQVDLHFHEGCFMRALEAAKADYGNVVAAHLAAKDNP